MAYTSNNDTNIIEPANSKIVDSGAGDDTYIISAANIGVNQTVTISDAEGANILRLVGGLSITSSIVASNGTQLTLSNGAVITALGADAFTYEIGGYGLAPSPVSQNFATFATDTLGTTVPAEDEATTVGQAVNINNNGSTSPIDSPPSELISITRDTVGVVGIAENFTYAIDSSSYGDVISQLDGSYTLSGFTVGEDSLTLLDVAEGTTSTDTFVNDVIVSSSSINSLTDIIFETNASGDAYMLTLTGIIDPDLSSVDMSVSS